MGFRVHQGGCFLVNPILLVYDPKALYIRNKVIWKQIGPLKA